MWWETRGWDNPVLSTTCETDVFLNSDGKENGKPVLISEALAVGGDGFDKEVQNTAPSYIKMYK